MSFVRSQTRLRYGQTQGSMRIASSPKLKRVKLFHSQNFVCRQLILPNIRNGAVLPLPVGTSENQFEEI